MKFIWSFFFQLFKIIYFVDVISSHDIQTAYVNYDQFSKIQKFMIPKTRRQNRRTVYL